MVSGVIDVEERVGSVGIIGVMVISFNEGWENHSGCHGCKLRNNREWP